MISKKNKNIVIIDYDCGNLHSIKNSFSSLGVNTIITNKKNLISNASHIVLPGVGAFDKAIDNLRKLDLVNFLKELNLTQKPILGICLGMQLLFESSVENKFSKGLGIIKGNVVKIKKSKSNKIPIIGWNKIKFNTAKKKITKKVDDLSYFYFIHSFKVNLKDKRNLISFYKQNNQEIPAIVSNNINTIGCQFHPEKSGKAGLQILKNFLLI